MMAARGNTKSKKMLAKEMQDILNDEDCEELEPGSGSIHAGNPTSKRPPNSLPLTTTTDPGYTRPRSEFADGYRVGGNGTVDVGDSPTDAMMHSMPDFSSATGLGRSASKVTSSSGTVTTNLVTSMTSPNWAGTSWTGGLTQGCSAAFRTSTSTDEHGTASTSVPLGSPAALDGSITSPSSSVRGLTPLTPSNKLETIKNWTISTYKVSRQSLYEKLGKTSRTVDSELETQIEVLRDTQRKYSNILRLARALTSHLYHVIQTQSALGECFGDLAHKSPELQEEFLYNSETQRNLSKNGQQLILALNFFVSSVNTLCNKTMEDTIFTVKQYETARIEFDAYRNDLEFYSSAPKTDVNMAKQKETEDMFQKQKQDFEKLRSDVQIKLKFLDENRVKVMHKQLLLFHNAVSAYFSGNQSALESTMKQFSIKPKSPNSTSPSWVEQ